MALTLDQMATELTARLDGPHTDQDMAAAAHLVAEAGRLGADSGGNPADTAGPVDDYLAAAAVLTDALSAAQSCLASLHQARRWPRRADGATV